MSISRQFLGLRSLMRRKPLLFNSVVYGTFYTGAEFAQQSYNRKYRSEAQQRQRDTNAERFVAIGASTPSIELRKSNESPVDRFVAIGTSTPSIETRKSNESSVASQIVSDYDWKQLQRYAIYGCFMAGPILHGCLFLYFLPSRSQTAGPERLPYDWMVIASYALLGTFVYSPIYYYWYKWLDRIFRGTTMRIIIVKLVADQFILTPPLLVLFFVSMSCMESRDDILHECKMKFVKTFQTSCIYWIPVQFVNFMIVPPAMRVLFVSVAAFCWVNILCYLKRLPVPRENLRVEK